MRYKIPKPEETHHLPTKHTNKRHVEYISASGLCQILYKLVTGSYGTWTVLTCKLYALHLQVI